MDKKLYEAVKTVKEYCENNRGCDGCPFNVESKEDGYIGCYEIAPADWSIEHLEQEVEEDA